MCSDSNAGYNLTCCARSVCECPCWIAGAGARLTLRTACAVYEDCTGETPLPAPQYPPILADGWSLDMPCAVDNAQRVLANVVVSYMASNSPYTCTTLCASKGYAYAGVEYSDECYCGTGYVGGVMPPAADLSECGMLCAGTMYADCGGSWRMQICTIVITFRACGSVQLAWVDDVMPEQHVHERVYECT